MVNKNKQQLQTNEIPTLDVTSIESGELNNNTSNDTDDSDRYVVIRNGDRRVSDRDYPTQNNNEAISELEFWQKVAKKSKDTVNVKIVRYDGKKHRIW